MKSDKINNINHYVFESDEEFRNHFIGLGEEVPKIVENWRDCKELDWVRADDGGIVQILRRLYIQHNKDKAGGTKFQKGYVRTIVGSFIIRDSTKMDTDFDMHPNRYSFTCMKTDTEGKARVLRVTPKLSAYHLRFIAFLLAGNEPWKAVCLASMQRLTKAYAINTATFMLKQPIIMEEITKQIDAAAQELGLDHKWVLERLKEISDRSEDDAVRRLAAKDIGTAIGTFGRADKTQKMLISGGFNGFGGADILDADMSDIRRPILNGVEVPRLNVSTVRRKLEHFMDSGFNPETDKF